jgi:hypothetical protein
VHAPRALHEHGVAGADEVADLARRLRGIGEMMETGGRDPSLARAFEYGVRKWPDADDDVELRADTPARFEMELAIFL